MGPRLLDMCARTYGFESHYHGEMQTRIFNMIFKGTPFDGTDAIRVKSETSFIPRYDDQTKVSFTIFESETKKADCFGGNWIDFGNGESPNGLEVTVQVPPEYLGRARSFSMWPELTYTANEILEITVKDRAGNRLAFASKSLSANLEAAE